MTYKSGFDQKYQQMTQEPVERLVCRMAGPTITIMMISALYNAADTYFVGSLGTSATGAVGVVFSMMAIIQAIGFLFGHGSGNYISRQLGAQNMEMAAKMAATGFFSALCVGGILTAGGLLFLKPLARFLGATDTIMPHACDYLFYILIGAPWMAASLMLNNLLRFQGSAFYGMIGMIAGAALNIILDPLFIFGLGMGIGGAGLATMLSQLVSLGLLWLGCLRGGNIRIDFRKFSPRFLMYKEILRGGLPSLLRQGVASIAVICLNRVAGGYGDAAIAAISVVQRVTLFANSALLGFGQGFQPVCGFNYGAGLYSRVRKAFFFCLKTAAAVLTVLAALGYAFAPQIIALFRGDDPEVIRIGTLALRLQCITFPLMAWVVLNNMMLQTIGMAFKASFLALARQGLFLLPLLFALSPSLGILGLQMSPPAADAATFLVSLPLGLGVLWTLQQQDGMAEKPRVALNEG